ncbi:MAG: molybdopterin-synthase adenylyltransferase MoeB [Cellvibrionaceae bacterium]
MNNDDLLRYSRQIMLSDIDVEGQEKLLTSSVLIVGLGGLGSPAALYLAAAGVGCLHLADFDTVDLSNLQRQIIHETSDIDSLKVKSAAEKIAKINSNADVIAHTKKLIGDELNAVIESVDLVVDCSDNFSTRFAINQFCVNTKTPLVSGAAIRFEGQVTVFDSRENTSPCYRCLYDEIDDSNLSCAESGVLAPLVGIIGSMQAAEAMKVLCGFGSTLVGRLQILDAKTMSWRELKLKKDSACPVCST